jgi:hypothetical protein
MTDRENRSPRWANRRLVDKTAAGTTGHWSGHNDPVTGPLPARRSASRVPAAPVTSALTAATSPAAAEVLSKEIRVGVGVALMWPMVAVFGFLALTGVVVALGATATARYEFERNGAREPQRRSSSARTSSAHPAGSRLAEAETRPQPQAVGIAVRPVPPAPGGAPVTGWWLVGESGRDVVAGPFPDRMDADWAALSGGHDATAVYGVRGPDGSVVRRPSPDERVWLDELGQQLDRLPEDWDELLTDTDELTTLVVEVTAALVEAGLPLHDCAQRGPSTEQQTSSLPAGGVCLTPEPGLEGILVSWRPHDRMSLQLVRGAYADAAVQQSMNAAIAEVLWHLGFAVQEFGSTGCQLVTAVQR